ncbi:MAG: site-2 protease family protein, partial [Acidobacteriota bacterium]|nr:site-2 protease family protein [Acidobacteriota bacterium]
SYSAAAPASQFAPRFDTTYPIEAFRSRRRLWLHALLFLLTLLTTSVVGAHMQLSFAAGVPLEPDFEMFISWWRHPAVLLQGLPFSLTLLAILLAHEFGHYLACVFYGLDASLPYFLPAPTFTGTLGAFIRIRSPIFAKRTLFDVGISGPIAGFIFLLPALSIGLAFSKIIPGIAHQGSLIFGSPPLLWSLEKLIFPGIPPADIYLHPVARAAWIGIFATALNLLPAGQLDGGHILYSLIGERHRLISRLFIALLIPLGIFYWQGWLLWAGILFFFARKHPSIYDDTSLGRGRRQLAVLALVIFLLCFTIAPIGAG